MDPSRATLDDVTRRRAAETALGEGQHLFERVAAAMPNVLYVYDLVEKRNVYVNHQIVTLLGYGVEEIEHAPASFFVDLVHPEDVDIVARLHGYFPEVADGDVVEDAFRARDSKGEWRWIRARNVVFSRTPEGKAHQILGTMEDITERRFAAQEAAASRTLLDQVANAAPIVLYLHDMRDRRDLFVNRQAQTVFGYPPEIATAGFLKLVHAEDVDRLVGARDRLAVAQEGDAVATEFRAQHASGEWRWYEDRVVALTRGEDGQPAQVLGTVQDITDRKRAEEAIRESEALFQKVADATPHVLFVYDLRQQRTIYINRRIADLFGYEPEEAKRSRFELLGDFIHAEDAAALADQLSTSADELKGGRVKSFECRVKNRTGEWRWVLCRMLTFSYDANGAPEQLLGTIEDVTERKRDEEELLRRGLALDTTSDAIGMSDASGNLIYLNPAFERLWGFKREELDEPVIRSLFVQPELLDALRKVSRRGDSWAGDVELRTKGGGVLATFLRLGPIHDAAARTVGTLWIVTDVTERKRAEQQARQHQAELAHALRISTLGEMAAGLAHELNQPLSAIASYANGCIRRLRAGSFNEADLMSAVEQIASEALRGGEIIHRLRDLVQKREPQRRSIELDRVIQEVLRLFEPEATQAGIRLDVNIPEDLPALDVDRIQVEQVLINLIRNGIDAIREVRAPGREGNREDRIAIVASTKGAMVELAVSDSGGGIASDADEEIFEPFFSTKPNGLGMGLSISRSIVEAHGGKLWASSKGAGGAKFHFTLPICDRAHETGA